MHNEKNSKKQVTLKPAEFQALINSSKLGGDVEMFLGTIDNIKLLRNNINKCLVYFLNQQRCLDMDIEEVDDILILQMFLENLQNK